MSSKTVPLALVFATVLVPASAMAMASAELYKTQAYTYGRFDARIQFAPGDGVVSAFFLWKEGSDASNAYWNELDYEKINADCHMQTNNIYGKPKTNHQQTPSLATICTAYHDYRFEWTPTYIAWVVDGKEIRRDTGADATAYAQNASGGMTFHFNIWPGNSSFGGDISKTTLPVHQYLSWVEYSSYDNGNFTTQWREEFQASGVPSGWGVGNWSSPYNLSTHNTQNVAFVNGIAELSLTADNATGQPATPPTDPSAGSAGGTSGTGGSSGSGGATGSGGSGTGGTTGSGGNPGSGGKTGSGGSGAGGVTSTGGSGAGGTTASGGTKGSGGATSNGGSAGAGGASGSGGSHASGGTTASSGNGGSGGSAGGTTGAAGSGGEAGSGGAVESGGAGGESGSGGANGSGGEASGSTAGPTTSDGGCNCSMGRSPTSSGLAFLLLFLFVSVLRRKKEM